MYAVTGVANVQWWDRAPLAPPAGDGPGTSICNAFSSFQFQTCFGMSRLEKAILTYVGEISLKPELLKTGICWPSPWATVLSQWVSTKKIYCSIDFCLRGNPTLRFTCRVNLYEILCCVSLHCSANRALPRPSDCFSRWPWLYPRFMTTDEDRNKDRFKNWQLCGVWMLPCCDHKAIRLTQNCVRFPIRVSVSLFRLQSHVKFTDTYAFYITAPKSSALPDFNETHTPAAS